MNRIVLIGNGFDLAHGLPTRYEDFLDWYWMDWGEKLFHSQNRVETDGLCSFEIKDNVAKNWAAVFQNYNIDTPFSSLVLKDIISRAKELGNFWMSPFLQQICNSVETKKWVDIENEYYDLLAKCALEGSTVTTIEKLNIQLHTLKKKLIEYLEIINKKSIATNDNVRKTIYSPIKSCDISVEATNMVEEYVKEWSKKKHDEWERKLYEYNITGISSYNYIYDVEDFQKGAVRYLEYPSLFMLPDSIMLLTFNYTKTAKAYLMEKRQSFMCNSIHGVIENPSSVIFGYGDELDDKYKRLQNLNNNECLKNVKTIKYLESDNYRNVLNFIDSAPYQIYIMGHSCGNSDRTLLNTLFEHKNCISIKPYYYKKEDGTDNYLELVMNISRNFTDMKLMRDRVVNKTYCEPLLG